MSLTPEELEQIRARANAATEGPWEPNISWCNHSVKANMDGVPEMLAKAMFSNDARFIAASRTDIPNLLAHVAALQAELDKRDRARILAGTPLTDAEAAVWDALTDAEVVLVYGEDADWMERVGRTRDHFQDVKVKILEGARERQAAEVKAGKVVA